MSDLPPSEPLIPVPAEAAANTHCSAADYDRLYAQSIADPDAFWAEQPKRRAWGSPPTTLATGSFVPVITKWYEDGALHISHTETHRHVHAGQGGGQERRRVE